MLVNQIVQFFRPVIEQGLITRGVTNVEVCARPQVIQQGVNSGPVVYFSHLFDEPYGFLKRSSRYDSDTSIEVHIELQIYLSTFQINALAPTDPTNLSAITTADLVRIVKSILESDSARVALAVNGLGIFRINTIQNPYFQNDRDEFEAAPSFDFVLSHQDVSFSAIPVVESVAINAYKV